MSRNKDIIFLHECTGLSYSFCRKRMKACNWNLVRALSFCDEPDPKKIINKAIETFFETLSNALGDFFVSLGKSLQDMKFRSE